MKLIGISFKSQGHKVGAAPRGRPIINTELQSDNIFDVNKLLGNGPAQGPARNNI